MDKRKELAKYGKLLHDKDLVIGAGGNISARSGDTLIIKKKFADMSRAKSADYVRVDMDRAAESAKDLSSETPLHVACYGARRDVKAVFHVHSPAMIAVSAMTNVLESPSYEFDCVLAGTVPVVDYLKPGSRELADAVASFVATGANAVLMRRHGAVSVGKDPEEAYVRILALERACRVFLYTR